MPRWGSSPGADATAIERAYKRLIKQHHPDREGGDARARRRDQPRLSGASAPRRHLRDPLELNDEWPPSRAREWRLAALALCCWQRQALACCCRRAAVAQVPSRPVDAASNAAIDRSSVARWRPDGPAARSRGDRRGGRARRYSSPDQRRDGARPTPAAIATSQFDRARALPSSTGARRSTMRWSQLQDRDPLRDQGPFSELAVTGRIWSGATALSDDSVAIDGRLDRIRLRVEVALAPLGRASGRRKPASISAGRRLRRRSRSRPPPRGDLPSGCWLSATVSLDSDHLRLSDASNFFE